MGEGQVFFSRSEALEALKDGKRVQFHWREKAVEITLETTLDNLRWSLMANLKLLITDVTRGKYSIIN